jgi:hypothetical protein
MTTGIRLAIRSSVERRRAAGAAAAQTRPGAAIAVRVDVRARRAVHDGGVAQDGGAAGRPRKYQRLAAGCLELELLSQPPRVPSIALSRSVTVC